MESRGAPVTHVGGGRGSEWTAAGIAARLRGLIDARDGGDVERAAARCGVQRGALERIAAALADDAGAARPDGAPAAAVLAAVARGYGVDGTWLVTGDENFCGDHLAPAARLRVADLLSQVGQRLLAARAGTVPASLVTVYDSPHDADPNP